jgi:hypothetical protein
VFSAVAEVSPAQLRPLPALPQHELKNGAVLVLSPLAAG